MIGAPHAHPMQVFRDACDAGTLLYQRCGACHQVQMYPRTHCSRCHRDALDWSISKRSGTLASFTVVHRAALARFQLRTPFLLALVDVDEGFRLMMNLEVSAESALAIGDAIAIGFVAGHDGHSIVVGRPAT